MTKAIKISLILFLFLPLLSCAQSIHQIEYEAHKAAIPHPSYFRNTDYQIVPIQQRKSSNLTHAIFGYLPDWEYSSAREYLQYDLLTHIAVFDFTLVANGDLTPPSYWPWVDVINTAHESGVKIILTVVNFNTSQIHTLLTNQASRENLFENLSEVLLEFDLQGVNIDFENVASADRGNLLNSFMSDLTNYLHQEVPGSEISFAAPPVNWGAWNFAGLAHACDYLFIMGYNFYGSWSNNSGPSAPLRGGSYNITKTIENQYAAVVNSEPHKLILGVPYYGDRWQTRTSAAHSATIDHLGHPRYKTAYEEALVHELKWDNTSQASWYSYKENNKFYQVWFETDSSLGLKYDLVLNHQLKGTGMWALGYDRDRTELWDELRLKFAESTATENLFNCQEFQIYPNPASEQLIIKYPVQSPDIRSGVIINIQGKVMLDFRPFDPSTPLSDHYTQGLATVHSQGQILVDISNLPKGIYIVKIGDSVEKFIKN